MSPRSSSATRTNTIHSQVGTDGILARGAEDPVVDGLEAGGDGLPGERLGPRTPSVLERRGELGLGQDPADRGGERVWVVRRDQEPVDAVKDHVPVARDVRGDHGYAGRHR